MCIQLIWAAHFFNYNTLQFNAVAREKLFEHVEKSMNEIGFESFYENHNECIWKHVCVSWK